MGYSAFDYCLQLKSVSTGNGLTSITTATFRGCKNLIEIDIGNSVTSIYSAFSDCGFTDIYIPDNVTYIGPDSFYYCSKLEKVVIGNGNTYIGEHAFCNCESLTDISIGNNVTAIGFLSFTNRYDQYPADNPLGPILDCSNIKYNEYDNAYYLGNSENPYLALISVKSTDVTTCEINKNTKIIAGYAFADCKNLNEIIIPDGLVLIIEPLGGVQPGTGIYPSVRNVFYKGTRDGWNRIVGNNSPCIMYAKIYFYSENRPSVKGDFWHYDESGKTAIW